MTFYGTIILGLLTGLFSLVCLRGRIGTWRAALLIPIWLLAADSGLWILRWKVFELIHGEFVPPAMRSTIHYSDIEVAWLFRSKVIPVVVVTLAHIILLVGFIIDEKMKLGPGRCRKCGYDLTGNLSGTCPECGGTVSEE